jgi:hypothetical protein
MPNDCPYCGKPHFNFGDDEEGVEMWINEPNDGEHVIVSTLRTHGASRSITARSAGAS